MATKLKVRAVKAPKKSALPMGLGATPERARHNTLVVEPADMIGPRGPERAPPGVVRHRVTDGCPLDAYLRRGKLTLRQHDAGSALARAFLAAHIPPPTTACYEPRIPSGRGAGHGPAEGSGGLLRLLVGAALAREDRAEGRVTMTGEGRIAIQVCGYDEWAGGSRNIAKLVKALDAIADFLRIPKPKEY